MNSAATEPEIKELGVHDCWRYLRSTSLCRIAFTDGGGVENYPVNFVPTNGTLLIRTGEGTKLASLPDRKAVAVEADGMNQYGTIAWSVILKGHAMVVSDDEEIRDAMEAGLSPWQPGRKNVLVRITPEDINGRRFVISAPTHWWPPREPTAD
ncbi:MULTISPECIES: pyridoxamine 5'-phosphate oxidase family protein [Pseudarthrobacter]|uniref:Nitroimidazol reductase NimA-like FMN-containing flavoprotein (Pyridoxamine 5'-phosphate oxidase superfamily) n=1 Tax=Pseudarthrobacter niigatensis TaxID=369935 RepID=A0AAJ1SSN2_9MICC|nr:pyridoxamine 5'-phosphate oxidase family protein [Pseudarthrobacter niigatensis]MDQ0144246.1 nitroimidazol reductase NimA-like FMN-containing flavoprotein (pyridoxamine 5'-phosphate oxidase superfamily) [Pseudarthrobacter niigatensis]MDQ0266506.1 nitroimidazol reductase NimA-like FMN-containing flavoprotein (pyridoxamine 5'-phosphate oxidase superfamily) [Pseudarthrobacter niigatensis]